MEQQSPSEATPIQALLERLPATLRDYVKAGNPVRTSPDDPEAGRCGGERTTGKPCRRVAGYGTGHTGLGRCRDHPDLHSGLAPWVGELPPEQQAEVTGANLAPRKPDGTFGETHGATYYGLSPIEKLFHEKLDDEEQEAFRLSSTNPIEVLDLQIRLRQTAQFQVARYIQLLRMSPEGRKSRAKVQAEILSSQKVLDMITQTIARLVEGKARWKELEGTQRQDEFLRGILGDLTFGELGELKRDPAALAALTK